MNALSTFFSYFSNLLSNWYSIPQSIAEIKQRLSQCNRPEERVELLTSLAQTNIFRTFDPGENFQLCQEITVTDKEFKIFADHYDLNLCSDEQLKCLFSKLDTPSSEGYRLLLWTPGIAERIFSEPGSYSREVIECYDKSNDIDSYTPYDDSYNRAKLNQFFYKLETFIGCSEQLTDQISKDKWEKMFSHFIYKYQSKVFESPYYEKLLLQLNLSTITNNCRDTRLPERALSSISTHLEKLKTVQQETRRDRLQILQKHLGNELPAIVEEFLHPIQLPNFQNISDVIRWWNKLSPSQDSIECLVLLRACIKSPRFREFSSGDICQFVIQAHLGSKQMKLFMKNYSPSSFSDGELHLISRNLFPESYRLLLWTPGIAERIFSEPGSYSKEIDLCKIGLPQDLAYFYNFETLLGCPLTMKAQISQPQWLEIFKYLFSALPGVVLKSSLCKEALFLMGPDPFIEIAEQKLASRRFLIADFTTPLKKLKEWKANPQAFLTS